MVRSKGPPSRPRVRSRRKSRDSTRPGWVASVLRRSNSPVVRATSSPQRVQQAPGRGVELPPGEAQERGRGRILSRRSRRSRRDAAQHGLDARHQLAQVERLGHIVVGPDFQADHLVDRIAAARDDHQPAAPVLAQLARDREAVLARQAEIEQDQGRRIVRHQGHERAARMQLAHAEALSLQVVREQQCDLDFVVEYGEMNRSGHVGHISPAGGSATCAARRTTAPRWPSRRTAATGRAPAAPCRRQR